MNLENIFITQESLRNESQLCEMIKFVQQGGLFTEAELEKYAKESKLKRVSPLMQLSVFEDNSCYLHDGHHRIVSIYLGGRSALDPNEYKITKWTYQDYMDVVFEDPNPDNLAWMGWVTPHDVREQVRLDDFKDYKAEVKSLYYTEGEEAALNFVKSNPHRYVKQRVLSKVSDLSNLILPALSCS